jgi:AcrR family transcriptional regulator
MTERKQGRRSAKTADETKFQILITATKMFCESGYERVSLRNISDQAGVSHSLIRHHFGSKEKIWYAISDKLHDYMEKYMLELLEQTPQGTPVNEVMYHFDVRLMAHLILVPEPLQFIADGIRQEGEFFDYFIDKNGKIEQIFYKLTNDYNTAHPDNTIELAEQKWIMISAAHAAIGLKPMLKAIWIEYGKDPEQCLLDHWKLFNRYSASSLCIPEDKVLHPQALEDLLLPMAACWKHCCSVEEFSSELEHS